jgi:hypothetical protein
LAAGILTLSALVLDMQCGRVRVVVDPPVPAEPAVGWGLPRCDLAGTRCYPIPTKKVLAHLAFAEPWHVEGDRALTGDLDGDGTLELVVGAGLSIQAYSLAGGSGGSLTPRCLWKTPDAGRLDLVADVTGSGAAEVIASGARGEQLLLRVFDGQGRHLRSFDTAGEIDEAETKHNSKALMAAYAVADLEQDGDKEIVAIKTMEGGLRSRGVVIFNYASGKEIQYHFIGPMVGDISVGKTMFPDLQLVHATCGPWNSVTGEDGTTDDRCYVYGYRGKHREALWRHDFDGEGYMMSCVGLSDLDGNGNLEMIATSCRAVDPDEGEDWAAGERGEVCLLDATDGRVRPSYQRAFDARVYYAGVLDVAEAGRKRVLVNVARTTPSKASLMILDPVEDLPTLHEFVAPIPGQMIDTAVAINDLNGDGLPEVVAVVDTPTGSSTVGTLYVLDSQLRELYQWKPGGVLQKPNVSDLNGDGVNDIIVQHNGRIAVLTGVSPASS